MRRLRVLLECVLRLVLELRLLEGGLVTTAAWSGWEWLVPE